MLDLVANGISLTTLNSNYTGSYLNYGYCEFSSTTIANNSWTNNVGQFSTRKDVGASTITSANGGYNMWVINTRPGYYLFIGRVNVVTDVGNVVVGLRVYMDEASSGKEEIFNTVRHVGGYYYIIRVVQVPNDGNSHSFRMGIYQNTGSTRTIQDARIDMIRIANLS